MKAGAWPEWWEWEIEITPHLERRMEDRDFTEVDVRAMLHRAKGYRADVVEDRYLVETTFRDRPWEIVVEVDSAARMLVVITAYQAEGA